MPAIEFKGHTFSVDEDGFIDDFNNWNESWVDYVKESEGIKELTDEHWKVIQSAPGLLQEKRHRPHGQDPLQGDGLQAQIHLRAFPLGTR